MKQAFYFLLAAFVFTSCSVNYDKTASGLRYKIYPSKEGKKIAANDFIKFNIEYLLQRSGEKDSVLNSTYNGMPGYTMVDTGKMTTYSFVELLPKSKVGDSLVFIISIDSLKSKGMIPEYNEVFKKGANVLGKVKIISVFENQDAMMKDYEAEGTRVKEKEIAAIESYLKEKNIKAVKTTNGAFVEVTNAGNDVKADTGKQATVQYRGVLMEKNKEFDAGSIDVVVGRHQVIAGWEEALPYFGEGGKGRIFIPSSLGYGPQGSPPAIPPFSNLMFEVEVKKVQKAAPQQQSMSPEMIQELIKQQQEKQQSQNK